LVTFSYIILKNAICRYGAAIIMETSHGYQVKDEGDEWVETAERVAAEGSEAADPSAHLVDYIPACKALCNRLFFLLTNLYLLVKHVPSWFPGTSWQRRADELRHSLETFVDSSHDWVKQQLVSLL
jgi:hypothetical protein